MGLFNFARKSKDKEDATTMDAEVGKFYVFSVNTNEHFLKKNRAVSLSYGNMFGSGDLEKEAKNLMQKFTSNDTVELVVVDSHSWSPVVKLQTIGYGMSNADFPLFDNIIAIKKYLLAQGITKEKIEKAVKIMKKQGLQFEDQVSRDILFGIPI